MRVAVGGTSGSGKSTFAKRLAEGAGLAFIEMDLLNWGPAWFDHSSKAPAEFRARVDAATSAPAWAIAGNYSSVRDLVWGRATHAVWLDLPKHIVMRQVIARSIPRAFGKEVFPGCREDAWRMLRKDHPIRFAWATFERRRAQYAALFEDPAFAHITRIRCASRKEANAALAQLLAVAAR
jgi:adenylate kinase family enzyme